MDLSQWHTFIIDLRSGPFAGRGGVTALAEALELTPNYVGRLVAGRQLPSYQVRRTIRKLWGEHFSSKS